MAFINVYQSTRRDTRIQIGAEELLFPMTFGNDWNRLRIAFRFTSLVAAPSASEQLLTARLFFGVCFGNGYSNRACGGWIGQTHTDGLTFNAVANNPGYWSTTYLSGAWKFNTSTNITNTVTTGPYATALRYPCHGAWMLDITRPGYLNPGSSWFLQPGCVATASASVDLTFVNFIEACRNFSTPGAYFNRPPGTVTLAGYPGSTNLNSVSIYWNRSVPVLEISDVVAMRIN